MSQRKTAEKRSTVRHTRAIQQDRRKRPLAAPPDAHIEARLRELLLPAIEAERAHFKALGLRERHLPLLVMVAIVISLIWRQLGSSGSEIARLLRSEGLLWVPVLQVTQQAISERLRTFPPELLWGCLQHLISVLQARAQARQRPSRPCWRGPAAITQRCWRAMAVPWTRCYAKWDSCADSIPSHWQANSLRY